MKKFGFTNQLQLFVDSKHFLYKHMKQTNKQLNLDGIIWDILNKNANGVLHLALWGANLQLLQAQYFKQQF